MVSDSDIQNADLSFEPPLTRRAKNRRVYLNTRTGMVMKGITVTSPRRGVQRINVPRSLIITNRPEHGLVDLDTMPHLGEVAWPISDLARETLTVRIRERLQQGIPLWPKKYW